MFYLCHIVLRNLPITEMIGLMILGSNTLKTSNPSFLGSKELRSWRFSFFIPLLFLGYLSDSRANDLHLSLTRQGECEEETGDTRTSVCAMLKRRGVPIAIPLKAGKEHLSFGGEFFKFSPQLRIGAPKPPTKTRKVNSLDSMKGKEGKRIKHQIAKAKKKARLQKIIKRFKNRSQTR